MKSSPIVAVLAVVAALLLPSAPAAAHTSLRSSDPAENTRVTALPRVTLEFSESVRFPAVVLTGPDGERYENGKPRVDGRKVLQDVGPASALPSGAYTIAYRVVSRDGHPVEGEIPFTYAPVSSVRGAVPATPQPVQAAAAPTENAPGNTVAPAEDEQIPAWIWIVIFGIAGIGIGMAFSMRKKP
ncbi:copper resistance protein CopC [Herbidospora galbida]|uniref:Copper resistance protein CopC n=1 Tax=Herbidospora galbida TaxID=2575442 RepID=A0A4U3M8F4_9ACTN|nr:copper resistance CopC family protein [Herbidospora galbida]TKK83857.1 copper resistance protein CopC [Herbidospora galbida]